MTLPMGLFSGENGHVLSKVDLRDLRIRETRASSPSLGNSLGRRNFSYVVVSVDSFVDSQIQAVRADVSEKGLWQVKSVDCLWHGEAGLVVYHNDTPGRNVTASLVVKDLIDEKRGNMRVYSLVV